MYYGTQHFEKLRISYAYVSLVISEIIFRRPNNLDFHQQHFVVIFFLPAFSRVILHNQLLFKSFSLTY